MNINRLFRAGCTSLLTMLVVGVVPSVTYAEDVLVFGGTGRLGSETVRQLLTSALYSSQHEIAVRHIVAGARPVGVKRIIHHGSVGAGDNMVLFPQIDSGIQYVIIRNGLLDNNDSKSSGSARLTENVAARGRITRRDLAAVTMRCLESRTLEPAC